MALRLPGRGDSEGIRSVRPVAQRREHADAFALEPADRIAQRRGRGRVEPLHVVDREDHRPLRSDAPQRREHGAAELEGPVRGRCAGGLLGVLEQIHEAGERQRHLLLDAAREQHLEALLVATVDPVPPQRRLADAGLAREHERTRAAGDGRDERVDATTFCFAADETGGSSSQDVPAAGHSLDYALPPRKRQSPAGAR